MVGASQGDVRGWWRESESYGCLQENVSGALSNAHIQTDIWLSGFVHEGVQRKGNWADGRWEDVICMGVLETEWAARYWNRSSDSWSYLIVAFEFFIESSQTRPLYFRTMFTTERLTLRAFRDDDADKITRMRNNVDVQRNVSTRAVVPLGPQNAQTVRKYVSDATVFVTITLKETGEFVGTSRLNMKAPKNRDCTFGICMLPEYWGKGYGKEVSRFMVDYGFKWLGLHRVSLTVVEGNKRAISVYEKLWACWSLGSFYRWSLMTIQRIQIGRCREGSKLRGRPLGRCVQHGSFGERMESRSG